MLCGVQVGDEVLHIELTRWADVLFISPCSANYVAKICNGLCDDLVMSVVRAWPPEKPVLLQLAMHMSMWKHPITSEQLAILNKQPNLYFVGQMGAVMEAVDSKDFWPAYGAGSIDTAVSVIHKLVGGIPYKLKEEHMHNTLFLMRMCSYFEWPPEVSFAAGS